MRFTHGEHAFIVATHTDRAHIHNHIIFNSTNLSCDRKFKDSWFIALALQKLSDQICLEHCLSVIKPRSPGERDNISPYHRVSFRHMLKENIDAILVSKPESFETFLEVLRDKGYEIKSGKNLAVRGNGQNRFIRFRSLGRGYTLPANWNLIRKRRGAPGERAGDPAARILMQIYSQNEPVTHAAESVMQLQMPPEKTKVMALSDMDLLGRTGRTLTF